MEVLYLFLLIAIPVILWWVSILILSKSGKFITVFLVNTAILVSYILYLLYGDLSFPKGDPYGLGKLMMFYILPVIHIFIGFGYAIIKRNDIIKEVKTVANRVGGSAQN